MANFQISKQDVFDIGKQMVRTFPYSECQRLNTFAVVDSADDLELGNLNKTYADYLNGTFWARKWVLEGGDSDKLCKQYPILAVEQKSITKSSLDSKIACYEFWFTILDVPDCPTCKDVCRRSVDQVDCDIQDSAMVLQQQLRTFGLYEIKPIGEEPKHVWTSAGQIANWMLNKKIEWYDIKQEFCDFIKESNVSIFATDVGLKDNARGVTFSFTVCTCPELDTNFTYTESEPKQIGKARCQSC